MFWRSGRPTTQLTYFHAALVVVVDLDAAITGQERLSLQPQLSAICALGEDANFDLDSVLYRDGCSSRG